MKLADFNVSRVNLIATLISKSEQLQYSNAVIDDASGKILLRSFDVNAFSKFDVGGAVLVIGKIREFNGERYIMPEILKKIDDAGWIIARRLELDRAPMIINERIENEGAAAQVEGNPAEIIYLLIKKLDDGNGASVDDIIKNSDSDNAESIINRMLENGDIFEVKPGKLKVLE